MNTLFQGAIVMKKLTIFGSILFLISGIVFIIGCDDDDDESSFNYATHISLMANPTRLPADGASTSTLIAEVEDSFGNRLTGQAIIMVADKGSLGPVTELDVGIYKAIFTASNFPTLATINAVVESSPEKPSDEAQVEMVASPPANLTLTAIPDTLPADGFSISNLTATITDTNGHPIQNVEIRFELEGDNGSISNSVCISNEMGQVYSSFSAGTVPGKVTIVARSGGLMVDVQIILV